MTNLCERGGSKTRPRYERIDLFLWLFLGGQLLQSAAFGLVYQTKWLKECKEQTPSSSSSSSSLASEVAAAQNSRLPHPSDFVRGEKPLPLVTSTAPEGPWWSGHHHPPAIQMLLGSSTGGAEKAVVSRHVATSSHTFN